MKSRFTTIDVCATITELREKLKGMRVTTVYDIDSKTYLIKLGKTDCKVMLLVESGDRIHTTEFEWPKNTMPSGFSMKCRKHLRSRRLVNISQLGVDRIVDLQFGSDEAAYHLIVELYDRGNIVLTDYKYTILSLLRTRTDTEDVKFAVRECYPIDSARQRESLMTLERLCEIVTGSKEGTELKKVLNPHVVYGTALLEHCLIEEGFPANVKIGSSFSLEKDLPKVMEALKRADTFMDLTLSGIQKGVIVQRREQKPSAAAMGDGEFEAQDELLTYQEFHPFLFNQHKKGPYLEFPSFDKAVDEFFSKVESQKLDMKALSQEKSAMKKLENVRRDHHRRIELLQMSQDQDMYKAELVELNLPLVDQAILIVNSAIANQIDWSEINSIVKEAQTQHDPVACAIGGLKLEKNHITMHLRNPYDVSDADSDDDDDEDETKSRKKKKKKGPNFTKVDINLALSAYANARSYYNQKKFSSKKEQKTIDASEKALKSAERKTRETLKEVATTAKIKKARKTYWFEKFLWFISSENYLVIGGRDQQQNELVVKRHLEQGDLYVHADLHGASSVIIKNPFSQPVPPKTLNEAGCMAVSYSAAWEARIVTSAWWVHHHQVSKTAPSGEYLTTGSFMIRGKKNFLPPCYLMMGFAFLFKLEEACIENHLNERRVKALEDVDSVANEEGEEELFIPGDDSDGNEQDGADRNKSLDADFDNDDEEAVEREGASDSLYPDTSIELQLTKEGKLQLQRSTSRTGGQQNSKEMETNEQGGSKQRLSAKQRRENRKKARQGESIHSAEVTEEDQDETQENVQPNNVETSNKILHQSSQEQQQKQQQAPKRGKKGKLKKIKEKYGEQDEDERQMKMEILASSGPAKESKADKRKKDKKGSKGRRQDGGPGRPGSGKPRNNPVTSNNNDLHTNKTKEISIPRKSAETVQGAERKATSGEKYNNECAENGENGSDTAVEEGNTRNEIGETEITNADIGSTNEKQTYSEDRTSPTDNVVEQETDKLATVLEDNKGEGSFKADDEGDKNGGASDEDTEDLAIKENMSLLDSLTGCPLSEDDLVFAVPVCAPYTAVQNYKYKVKLTPGTSRRGKAAKTALNAFLFSKEATQREKDLLKSLKDNDLSRHIPGKVKVSAPNLQKVKRK